MNLKRIPYSFGISSATVMFACTVALAQMTQPKPVPQPEPSRTQRTQAPAHIPALHRRARISPTRPLSPKRMEGDNTEVQLGQLAEEKSQSADVKQLAQKLVSEHSQMNDKWFMPVAQQLGVSQPKGPSKKDKKEIARSLQQLSGHGL